MTAKKPGALSLPTPPTTDEYLASVTVGERKRHDATIHLAPYDPRWPSMFAGAAERIRSALGERASSVEHVGSTAVPGLAAKPIIDMVLVVEDSADEGSYVPSLEALGFVLRVREPDWFRHRLLVLESRQPKWQLHVFSVGCGEVDRMLAFRDWLRTHDDDRQRYEAAKLELAARTWKHVQHYADAKSGVIREILGRAVEGTHT